MTLNFAEVGQKPQSKKKEDTKFVMLTPTAPQIGPVQKELDQYKPKLAELEKQAKELKVTDNESFQISVDGAATAKGLIKAIDGRKAEVTGPYREFINKVNNAAKFFTDPLKRVATEFSRKGGDYQYHLQLAEEKQKKLIAEEQRKLQEKLDKQAKKDGVPPPQVIDVKPPKPETVIHTAGGFSQHLRKPWVGEIEDAAKVPREYCEPSTKLINIAIRQGERQIPGVKIYQKVTAVHR